MNYLTGPWSRQVLSLENSSSPLQPLNIACERLCFLGSEHIWINWFCLKSKYEILRLWIYCYCIPTFNTCFVTMMAITFVRSDSKVGSCIHRCGGGKCQLKWSGGKSWDSSPHHLWIPRILNALLRYSFWGAQPLTFLRWASGSQPSIVTMT